MHLVERSQYQKQVESEYDLPFPSMKAPINKRSRAREQEQPREGECMICDLVYKLRPDSVPYLQQHTGALLKSLLSTLV
jgi:hypothetical protein